MRSTLAVILALALAGCATMRVGPLTPHTYPQADEQCVAQPALDWCP